MKFVEHMKHIYSDRERVMLQISECVKTNTSNHSETELFPQFRRLPTMSSWFKPQDTGKKYMALT